ncbi:SUKH-4 family immunity protein [Micromonospora sp. NPDC050200]|uniref:SUKH-4 family immunity protein n=1 Tax=Micromonospora sp. NPDC050200 TaxID=3155664 RepID=UPI00341016EF
MSGRGERATVAAVDVQRCQVGAVADSGPQVLLSDLDRVYCTDLSADTVSAVTDSVLKSSGTTLIGVPVEDLPVPPAFEAVTAWAGAGRVVRAAVLDVATWRLPELQKAALVSSGVPLIDDLVGAVSFHAEPTMYQLAFDDDVPDLAYVYGAAPGTGEVLQVWPLNGSTRIVNSTINHWLCSLHLVGSWLTSSTVIGRWDDDGQAEEEALAELADLLERIRALDPPAFGDGDHRTHFWPAVLDRWLY